MITSCMIAKPMNSSAQITWTLRCKLMKSYMWCKAMLLSFQPRVSRKEWTARSQEATFLRETSGRVPNSWTNWTRLKVRVPSNAWCLVWLHHALVKNDSYPAFKNVYQTLLFQITYKRLCIGIGNADSRTLTSDLITQWVNSWKQIKVLQCRVRDVVIQSESTF